MVEFATLFLGLVFGSIQVELSVDGAVSSVVLELDGEQVAELAGSPWSREIDLGAELRPRRLTARALDADGLEVDRATRYLNLYRPPGEVEYVVHRNSKGWLTKLQLTWEGEQPERFAVSVDGVAVHTEDPAEVWVPPLDPDVLHRIEVVAELANGLVVRDWIGFGGSVLGERSAYLTPLPTEAVVAADETGADSVRAHAGSNGEGLTVVAVERGEPEAIFVRDTWAALAADSLAPRRSAPGTLSGARDANDARRLHAVPLLDEEWVRILNPAGPRSPGTRLDPQQVTLRLTSDQPGGFGLLWHLRARDQRIEPGPAWVSDALALGASRLAMGRRRGAVVLVLAPESADERSVLSRSSASSYLATLGVPLRVWYLGRASNAPQEWGEVRELRGLRDLETALAELRADLEALRIVWLEGRHLPGEVVLSSAGG